MGQFDFLIGIGLSCVGAVLDNLGYVFFLDVFFLDVLDVWLCMLNVIL